MSDILTDNIKSLGFVIVRHMCDERSSQYWYKSCQYIRKFYPDAPIVIVDDDSERQYVDTSLEETIPDLTMIQSEFPRCGEMLGYYYYWKHRWFQRAVVMHDSVFLTRWVDFEKYKEVRFLWCFVSKQCNNVEIESDMFRRIGGDLYFPMYEQKEVWKGCFGVMSVIEYKFLKKIENIFTVLPMVKD